MEDDCPRVHRSGHRARDIAHYAFNAVWKNRPSVPRIVVQGDNKPLYLDHAQFEGFEVCLTTEHETAAISSRREDAVGCRHYGEQHGHPAKHF
jgi:hypothetical protein